MGVFCYPGSQARDHQNIKDVMMILIRADGSNTLGMGHLYRSLALVQMLEGKYNVTFISREITPDFAYILAKNNYNLIEIENENQFLDNCGTEKIVVIDGHHFPSELYQKVKEKGSYIICIDDLHDKNYASDVMLNQAPGIIPKDYHTTPFTYYGLGPDYALLRKPFLEASKNKRTIDKIISIFICFGGGDQLDLTLRAVKTAAGFNQLSEINVVTGSAYLHHDSLNEFSEKDIRIKLFNAIDEYEIASLMTNSHLAIIPCSTILLEIFAAGCVPISGYYVENQKYFYHNFLDKNAFIDAGNFSEIEIKNAIETALTGQYQLSEIIDGNSKKRIQKCFQFIQNLKSLELKIASIDDLKVTFEWASNPEVRKWSFSTNPILFEEHQHWFSNKIVDPKCVYFIASYEEEKIGSIRFDMKDQIATISYLLDPKFHGKGLGQALLAKGCRAFLSKLEKSEEPMTIEGFVSKGNLPSIASFEKLGFQKSEVDNNYRFVHEIN